MDDTSPGSIEDRNAFRIDIELDIVYRLASMDELNSPIYEFDLSDNSTNVQLLKTLEGLNQEAAELLGEITLFHKGIASYLMILDNKIKLLAKAIISSHNKDKSNNTRKLTNLSETGIAFNTNEQFNKGDILRIQMVLQPGFHEITAYGKVVASNINSENNYTTAMQFDKLQAASRQLLSRYILSKQHKNNI